MKRTIPFHTVKHWSQINRDNLSIRVPFVSNMCNRSSNDIGVVGSHNEHLDTTFVHFNQSYRYFMWYKTYLVSWSCIDYRIKREFHSYINLSTYLITLFLQYEVFQHTSCSLGFSIPYLTITGLNEVVYNYSHVH